MNDPSRIRPVDQYIVVRPDSESLKVSSGGIHIPDTAKVHKQALTRQGVVLAVGPGRVTKTGVRVPVGIAVGDRVVYEQYSGYDHQFDVFMEDSRLRLIKEEDVIGILDPEPEPTWEAARDELRKEGWQL